MEPQLTSTTVAGARIELVRCGKGRPILYLHPHIGMEQAGPFIKLMAANAEVIAPSHPGFGESERPKGITSIDDIAYLYLEMLKDLDLHDVLLVGSSLGAWIALAMAVKSPERFAQMVLADPVGVKFSARDKLDIADIYAIPDKKFIELAYHDPSHAHRDYAAMSDEELMVVARNSESTARFCWSPYMYDPRLRHLLYRLHMPTLILWGASDRFAPLANGKNYVEAIVGAKFMEIANAGHFPHIEQPQATAEAIAAFIQSRSMAAKHKEIA
ncbi:MAG: alpha/beta fold hydrolase [Burkholderiales bacterium]